MYSNQINFLTKLLVSVPFWIKSIKLNRKNQVVVQVKSENLLSFIDYLKNHMHTHFELCIDISGIDLINTKPRFLTAYQLLSIRKNSRIIIEVLGSSIPSITEYYPSANWMERESWDMFGIFYQNHPDLRRILTDYGFKGYPMRKDFPLTGYVEVRYDDTEKRVVTENIELTQEYRSFEFTSPWA